MKKFCESLREHVMKIIDFKKKQASLSGCLTTLEWKRIFRPQFGPQKFFGGRFQLD